MVSGNILMASAAICRVYLCVSCSCCQHFWNLTILIFDITDLQLDLQSLSLAVNLSPLVFFCRLQFVKGLGSTQCMCVVLKIDLRVWKSTWLLLQFVAYFFLSSSVNALSMLWNWSLIYIPSSVLLSTMMEIIRRNYKHQNMRKTE